MVKRAPRKKKVEFKDLVRTMAKLRAPGGCAWDRKQTHRSLLKYLREESQEACEAVAKKDWDNLREELGDVLHQVLFHADLAKEEGYFDIHDVLAGLQDKMVRRHPHVFAKGPKEKLSAGQVRLRWAEIKRREKLARSA